MHGMQGKKLVNALSIKLRKCPPEVKAFYDDMKFEKIGSCKRKLEFVEELLKNQGDFKTDYFEKIRRIEKRS